MQRDLALVKPTRKYASQVMHYKQEMLANNDSLDGCAGLEDTDSFDEWIDFDNRLKKPLESDRPSDYDWHQPVQNRKSSMPPKQAQNTSGKVKETLPVCHQNHCPDKNQAENKPISRKPYQFPFSSSSAEALASTARLPSTRNSCPSQVIPAFS